VDVQLRQRERRWRESGTYDDCKTYAISLQRSGVKTLEVVDGHPEDLLNYFWPKVTYRGIDCIELISKLDEHSGDVHGDYDDAQESFLGWIPEKDWMVIGWDAERTYIHTCSNSCEEECDERDEDLFFGVARMYTVGYKAVMLGCHEQFDEPGGFYGAGNGLLKVLKEKYPSMIGLRYD